MHPVPLFRGAALRPLLDFLAHIETSPARVFGRRLAALRDTRALLPLSAGGRAWEAAALELDRTDLGLHVGETTQIERIGELGAMLRAAPTLGAALAIAERFGSRFNTGQRFWLVRRGDDVWVHRAFASSLTRGRTQVSDFVTAVACNVVRLAAGPAWRPTEIRFEGPPPRHAEQLAALASRRVCFGGATTAFAIPFRLLALPFPDWRARGEWRRGGELPASDALGSLQQTLDALHRLGEPEVAAAAEAAGTSVRSLQRQLHAAGTSFGELVQRTRFRAACRMLADSGLKIVEISAALGYTDSANFTRAFRRWSGLSPRDFRRAAGELPGRVIPVTPAAGSPASLPIG